MRSLARAARRKRTCEKHDLVAVWKSSERKHGMVSDHAGVVSLISEHGVVIEQCVVSEHGVVSEHEVVTVHGMASQGVPHHRTRVIIERKKADQLCFVVPTSS